MNKSNLYKKKFSENGYVIIKNFLSTKEASEFENTLYKTYTSQLKTIVDKENIHSIIQDYERRGYYDKLYMAYKKFGISSTFKKFSRKLVKLTSIIFNNKSKSINCGLVIGINGSKRTNYEWHQEKPYYPKISTVHYQFPLLNFFTSKKNGTMSVLKGSNKLGFIREVTNKKLSKKSINSYVPKDIKKIKKNLPEKFINMHLKDIVLFDENLIHKSNENRTKKVRFAGVVRLKLETS